MTSTPEHPGVVHSTACSVSVVAPPPPGAPAATFVSGPPTVEVEVSGQCMDNSSQVSGCIAAVYWLTAAHRWLTAAGHAVPASLPGLNDGRVAVLVAGNGANGGT